jgi:hypothetical protein
MQNLIRFGPLITWRVEGPFGISRTAFETEPIPEITQIDGQ